MKSLPIGTEIVKRTVKDLFNTDINSGKLEVIKQKAGNQATVSDNNLLVINPAVEDSLKIQYQYLNKKYKINIKVK